MVLFKEKDRFNLRCRLPEGEIPQCMALIVNKTSVDLLTKANLSHYQMLGEVEKIFKKCAACHSIEKGGPNKIGPALYNVVGSKVGAVEDYKYSKTLASYGKDWTFEELNGFLTKPSSYLKGTKMSYAGLRKEADRASIIKYLNQNSDSPKQLP